MNYDVIVIGSGPGGYVAAVRAGQLGLKVGIVERENLGGVCLNWGCIPTKSLLKSARVYAYVRHAAEYGVSVQGEVKPDFRAMVKRSRDVAQGMSRGVRFLLKKNKVEVLTGNGKLAGKHTVEVTGTSGSKKSYTAGHVILATGARSRELPNLKQDGKKVIGYREALGLSKQPESMVVVGSGAIGSEFAHFYQSIGTRVTLVEFMPVLVPNEDEDVSKTLEKIFRGNGMEVYTNASVESVDTSGKGCRVAVKTADGGHVEQAEVVLSAVGISPNIEQLGLEQAGVVLENGKIKVDAYYHTTAEGVYAIGDIVPGPALAHVASAEAVVCVEKIAGRNPRPVDYELIPGCTYTDPEIASVGLTEQKAREAGYELKIGRFPYTASGKANAGGHPEGFVKLIFDARYGELLGAHLIGANVTEMIAELVVAKKLEITGQELVKSVHPHPTMSEAVMEAAAAAYGEVIHL
ncbi:MAG: dihydrolipoyl dehydrogenase [Mangrovibacterium sp.]